MQIATILLAKAKRVRRLSGIQLQVLSQYRAFLRAVYTKPKVRLVQHNHSTTFFVLSCSREFMITR